VQSLFNYDESSRYRRSVPRDEPIRGNLPPMPGVFPDYPAPVVRNAGDERELVMMRWGMPPPPRNGGPPVTNIRNTSSPHWRGWLKPENRCLVPFNSFAEYAPEPNPETKKKDVVWFALNDDRPLTAFAGIWTEFGGDRRTKSKPIPGPHLVYGFLTTAPNAIVEPIHDKAMPVILTTDEHAMSGCARPGTRRRRCSGRCRMMRSKLSPAAKQKRIKPPPHKLVQPLRRADPACPAGRQLVTLEDAGTYITLMAGGAYRGVQQTPHFRAAPNASSRSDRPAIDPQTPRSGAYLHRRLCGAPATRA
jgi:putative SOS response-associated peptidase YedK